MYLRNDYCIDYQISHYLIGYLECSLLSTVGGRDITDPQVPPQKRPLARVPKGHCVDVTESCVHEARVNPYK